MLPRTYRLSIYIVFFATLQLSIPIAAENTPEQPNLTLPDPEDAVLPEVMGFSFMNGTKSSTATETTLRSPQVPLDVERYTVAPLGLQLEQVHVYVRHGERTPVGVRMANPPASIPEHWMMCKTAPRFQAAVSSLTGVEVPEALRMRKVVEREDGTAVEGECLLGELTDLGRQTTHNYGKALRDLYIKKLGFLSDTLRSQSEVYYRSTNMPRTMESLQQVVYGLYPKDKCLSQVEPPLHVRNGKDENLIGNTYACKRLEILQVGFAKAAADAYSHTLEHLDKKLSKYIDGNPVRVDGKPRASGILDTIRAASAHGIKVPPEFEDKAVIDTIERAVTNEWFADKTEEGRRLGMGRLLSDMSFKMHRKAEQGDKDPLKILIHSTHDTAIAALCSTFDVFDEKWPAFTASITFELFSKTVPVDKSTHAQKLLSRLGSKAPVEHYVRMRYQNKNMILPMCAEEGDHLEGSPEFCTFSAFRQRVLALTPVDWDSECSPAGRS